jgi:hypothetical protein
MSRQVLKMALNLKDDEHLRKAYILPALWAGFIEMTRPDRPRSSKQKYRLTDKGRAWLRKAHPSVRRSQKGEDV